MADPTTTNIVLAVPTRGSDVGTWDVPLNGDMTILDACFGAVTTKALTNVNIVFTTTESQANLLRFSGTLTNNIEVTIPAIIKGWSVENLCVGNFFVRLNTGAAAVCAPPGQIIDILSDGTSLKYRNLPPVGSYLDIASTTVPIWVSNSGVPPYLNCDGSTYSSTTYPALFAILGTTTLPDFRGRNRSYLNQGTSRITSAVSGIDGDTRFSAGGVQSVILDATQIPTITPTFTGIQQTITVNDTTNGLLSNSGIAGQVGNSANLGGRNGLPSVTFTPTGTISSFGGGLLHTNMQPTAIGGITMIRSA